MTTMTYCVASAKGGSGKTALSACIGAFLAALGKRVLLVDVDYATNGLTLLYLDEVTQHKDAADAASARPGGLFDGQPFSCDTDLVHLSRNLDLLPATYNFRVDNRTSDSLLSSALKQVIAKVKREDYDYIFLDAQAGADAYSRVPMRQDISDEVVIVSEYDPLSSAGVERLKYTVGQDLDYARTWILLNKLLPDFVDIFSDFLQVAKYLTPVPWLADVPRAYARGKLPLNLEYGNRFTLALIQTLDSLLDDQASAEMKAWIARRAAHILKPTQQEYRSTGDQVAELQAQRRWRTGATAMINTMLIGSALFIGLTGVAYWLNDTLLLLDTTISSLLTAAGVLAVAIPVMWGLRRHIAIDKHEAIRIDKDIRALEERLRDLDVVLGTDAETLITQREELTSRGSARSGLHP